MATQSKKLVNRVDSLEWRMGAMEEKHKEIMAEIKPLKDLVSAMSGLQKIGAFVVIAATLLEVAMHFIK